jgi:penicillin amidase
MPSPSVGHRELQASLPDTVSTLGLKGLNAPIEVVRDHHGIPHIRAQSANDAFFGQGFAAAQDRLWQMDRDRRRALGRWAEWIGQPGVAEDMTMRRFQLGLAAQADYATVSASTRAMLDAYSSGVNAFIQSTASLPIEYTLLDCRPEPWKPWECLAVFKVRHIFMGTFEAKLWRARFVNDLGPERAAELHRGYPQGHPLIVPPGAAYDGPVADGLEEMRRAVDAIKWLDGQDAGSNNWVLSGSRTASGKPLMAGDPHRALDVPNAYYQNHISCPEFDVVGLSFAGCPGYPHFGHNAHLAWSVTHGSADYQDLFLERFSPDDPMLYDYQGQWKAADLRHETVLVRNSAPIEMDVTVTHHGPIVAGDPHGGHGAALRYTATAEPNTTFDAVLGALTATTVDELNATMGAWVEPCNNLLCADTQGDISYLLRGKLPVRSTANAWLPVPGWTGEHEWQGYVPFNELVRSRNPETGYIVTANNRIAGDDYPHYISLDYAQSYRAQRVADRIAKLTTKATPEDMASIHAERVSIPGRTYARLLAQVKPQDELSAKAQQHLAQWDGAMDPSSVAAAIYSAFRERLHRRVIGELVGPSADRLFSDTTRGSQVFFAQLPTHLVEMASKNDPSLLPPGADWSSVLSQALAEGAANLRGMLGDDMDTWTWGAVHATKPRHPLSALFPEQAALLNPPSIAMGGDGDTPQQGNFSRTDPFTVSSVSVARYVFDLADWNSCAWVIPLGESGHPGSSHYADQAPAWGAVELVPMLYDWERIAAHAESTQRLEPA